MAFEYFKKSWDDEFHRLYYKASAEQWSVADLDWDQLGAIDADYKRGMVGMLTPLIVSERGAMQACGTMMQRLRDRNDQESELVMHAMGLDEARHWEGLNRLFNEVSAEPKPINEFKEALGINYVIMRCGDFDQWLWCIQICDIIAGVLYNALKSTTDCKPVEQLFDGFLRDEARHHRFCNLFFAREASKFTREQQKRYRRQGDKLLKKFEALMKVHLADYMKMIGADGNLAYEKVAKAVDGQANKYGFLA